MEIFVAVDFDHTVDSSLVQMQKNIINKNKKLINKIRCESILHLTLRYLGKCKSVDYVITQLSKVEVVPFTIRTSEPSCFDNEEAMVIWAGVEGDLIELNRLKAKIDRVLEDSTYDMEPYSFTPHISLFSIKDRTVSLQQIMNGITCESTEIHVNQFKLFAIHEGQVSYTEICTFR